MEFEVNKIYCGDCLDIMGKIPDNFVDLTVTSPPYDDLRDYKGYNFDFEAIAMQLYRLTKPGAVVVWVVGDGTVDGGETGTSFKQALYFKEVGFRLHDTMIWNKSCFSSPSSNRYHQVFEYMFIFCKGSLKTFNPIIDRVNISKGRLEKTGTKREKTGKTNPVKKNNKRLKPCGKRFNIWDVYPKMGRKNNLHPAPFPDKLANDHITSWSTPGDIVLDPMCGSGTTCKMAKKNQCNYIGIDISPEYCKIAEKRVNSVYGLFI